MFAYVFQNKLAWSTRELSDTFQCDSFHHKTSQKISADNATSLCVQRHRFPHPRPTNFQITDVIEMSLIVITTSFTHIPGTYSYI